MKKKTPIQVQQETKSFDKVYELNIERTLHTWKQMRHGKDFKEFQVFIAQ